MTDHNNILAITAAALSIGTARSADKRLDGMNGVLAESQLRNYERISDFVNSDNST